ncbi:hypothetical protein [Streptomyces sp. NPDC012888]|uniref:hypothetical protein n=1 Tax=Streptomyces sp. NPDC012888 TaxID=3364855 RepID=UPI003685CF42
MHPTRTTTTLLLGVAAAVSAVSGCVNVTPASVQPAAAPVSEVPPRHEPRSGPGAEPVVVQAPALEALQAAPADSGPAQDAPGEPPAPPTPPLEGREPEPDAPAPAPPPVPDIPEPVAAAGRGEPTGREPDGGDRPGHAGPEARKVERELMKRLPVRPADVCALGRKHGKWRPDSPESRICPDPR